MESEHICWQEGRFVASVPINVVLKLSDSLLGCQKITVTDNYYTSVELANKLYDCDTHYLGTLHTNSKSYPCKIINEKWEKDDLVAMEDSRGIMTQQ
jgi:hypothetical protein